VLDEHPDDLRQLEISPGVIASIIEQDSEGTSIQMWEEVDEFTSAAQLQGQIERSTYQSDFDSSGRVTYAVFQSSYAGLKVGISRSSVWSFSENDKDSRTLLIDYFVNVIQPEI
jgi:hypothetical protein